MKTLALLLVGSAALAGAASFTGIVTDQMCGGNHSMMGLPAPKCVTECVKRGSKYALYDGNNVYVLSDQKSPEQYAGQKVTVTGKLDSAAKTIKVDSIAAAK